MSGKLVISPSGNFYGSEQVLFDYLQNTKLILDVAVPEKSIFLGKLRRVKTSHHIRPYNNKRLKVFYCRLFCQLLFGKYNLVYLNEAGHIKYLILLARFFRKKNFIVHVRMLEDSDASRWKQGIPGNLTVLAISKYISELLPVKNSLLYDAYSFSDKTKPGNIDHRELLRVAIIGRITKTKGLGILPGLMDQIRRDGEEGKYAFQLYGEIADDVKQDGLLTELRNSKSVILNGFEENKGAIYNSVDCILHLSKQEALGRIFFEALDYFKPLVGFKAAGIGEIAELLELSHLLADPQTDDPAAEIYRHLKDVKLNYKDRVQEIEQKKNQAIQIFNPALYQARIDNLLSA